MESSFRMEDGGGARLWLEISKGRAGTSCTRRRRR